MNASDISTLAHQLFAAQGAKAIAEAAQKAESCRQDSAFCAASAMALAPCAAKSWWASVEMSEAFISGSFQERSGSDANRAPALFDLDAPGLDQLPGGLGLPVRNRKKDERERTTDPRSEAHGPPPDGTLRRRDRAVNGARPSVFRPISFRSGLTYRPQPWRRVP